MQTDEAGEAGRDADRELLLQGAELRRPIARAAKLARMNGAGYVLFGVLSLLLSLPLDIPGLAIGAVLLGVGVWERKQATQLIGGALDAPARLALGELLLMLAVIAYSALQMTVLDSVGRQLEEQFGAGVIDPGLIEMADAMSRTVYAVFIAVALLYQGSMALRFRRLAPLQLRYVTRIPPWVREILAD